MPKLPKPVRALLKGSLEGRGPDLHSLLPFRIPRVWALGRHLFKCDQDTWSSQGRNGGAGGRLGGGCHMLGFPRAEPGCPVLWLRAGQAGRSLLPQELLDLLCAPPPHFRGGRRQPLSSLCPATCFAGSNNSAQSAEGSAPNPELVRGSGCRAAGGWRLGFLGLRGRRRLEFGNLAPRRSWGLRLLVWRRR